MFEDKPEREWPEEGVHESALEILRRIKVKPPLEKCLVPEGYQHHREIVVLPEEKSLEEICDQFDKNLALNPVNNVESNTPSVRYEAAKAPVRDSGSQSSTAYKKYCLTNTKVKEAAKVSVWDPRSVPSTVCNTKYTPMNTNVKGSSGLRENRLPGAYGPWLYHCGYVLKRNQ